MTRPPVVVILDADSQYAVDFCRAAASRDLAVVLGYQSRHRYYSAARNYPGLLHAGPVSVHLYSPDDLTAFARGLAARYDVRACIPHSEDSVDAVATLGELLGRAWCDAKVLHRFRDKAAMKRHLLSTGGAVVTAALEVCSVEQIRQFALTLPAPGNYVLKPVDGSGNRAIHFGNQHTDDTELSDYLDGVDGRILAEPMLVGEEYQVNGQVDGDGRVEVFAVIRSLRMPELGGSRLALLEHCVPAASPAFRTMADYGRSVVAAAGLVRSPFHMEAMLTLDGPRLIEIAARLAGAAAAYHMDVAHADLHSIDLATHYYLGGQPRPVHLDWTAYDRDRALLVYGLAESTGTVCSVQGVAAIEAVPQFIGWGGRPVPGQAIRRTVDLASKAYLVLFRWQDDATAQRNEAFARTALRWRIGPVGNLPKLAKKVRGLLRTAAAVRHHPTRA